MRVGEPTANGYGVLRVEYVGRRRVVDDDGVLEVTPDLGEILDVVAAVVVAALSEQSVVDDTMDVELVEKGVSVLYGFVSKVPQRPCQVEDRTLDTEAVKTTTSYSSPTLFINWSTPGRLIT